MRHVLFALLLAALSLTAALTAQSAALESSEAPSFRDAETPTPAAPLSAVDYHDLAYEAYDAGDYTQAVRLFTRAITLDPTYMWAYNGRANAYYYLQDYEAALADYTAAIELDPQAASVITNRGNVYLLLGDTRAALADYTAAIQADPDYALAYYQRASLHFGLGSLVEGINDSGMAIILDPTYPDPYLLRGLFYQQDGDTPAAAADFLRWIELIAVGEPILWPLDDRTPAELQMSQGTVYHMPFIVLPGDLITIRAEGFIERGGQIDPLIVLLDENGQPLIGDDDGAGGLDSLIENYQPPAGGVYTLVVSHAGGGSDGLIRVTLSIESLPATSPYAEGMAAYNRGAYNLAVELFTSALETDGPGTAAYNMRGNAYFYLGDYTAAAADYGRAIELDPEYSTGYFNRGNTYLYMEDYPAALADLDRALELDAAYTAAYLSRGIVHQAMGSESKAAEDYYQWMQLNQHTVIVEEPLEPDKTLDLFMQAGTIYNIPLDVAPGATVTITAEGQPPGTIDPLIVLLAAGEPVTGDDDGLNEMDAALYNYTLPEPGPYVLVVGYAGAGSEGNILVTFTLGE